MPRVGEGTVDPTARARADRSEAALAAHGVAINPHLPLVENEFALRLRQPARVAERIVSLLVCAGKAIGGREEDALAFLRDCPVRARLSPKERRFLEEAEPTQHQMAQFSWGFEAAWTLTWALGRVDGPMGLPVAPGDARGLTELARTTDLAASTLRPTGEIADALDLTYRAHWALRQASLDAGATPVGALKASVALERHRALNWLTCYADARWDDVTTDT